MTDKDDSGGDLTPLSARIARAPGQAIEVARQRYPVLDDVATTALRGAARLLPGGGAAMQLFDARSKRDSAFLLQFFEGVAEAATEEARVLRGELEDVEARLEERTKDPSAGDVVWRYAEQATREPVDERRRLLEHAGGAVVNVRLSVAQHSRVERVMRELDPEDVLWLAVLNGVASHIFEGKLYEGTSDVRGIIWGETESSDVLASSGCVRSSAPYGLASASAAQSPTRIDVTRLGRHVLLASRGFIAARNLPRVPPGREVPPGSRSAEDVRDILLAVPGLVDGVATWARRSGGSVRYDPPLCGSGPGEPARARGLARLLVELPEDEVVAAHSTLESLAKTPERPQHGELTEDITCDVVGGRADGFKTLRISGPHDVLRVLAEDAGASWVGAGWGLE